MILLDRYEYDPETDRLGKGGFASVYKARDLHTDRMVALKFVQKSKIPERYTLFEETERVKSLEHPNLVKYYDFFIKKFENVTGEKDEIQIGVMEYINGGDMGAYMRVQSSRNPRRIAELLRGVLGGLQHLHENRIVHRDVKPQNILLQIQDGAITPKVADFSISKELRQELTSVSAAVGTYEYMSPEQLGKTDAKLGIRTDIWSFGVLTYQLLTSELPFGSRRKGDTDGKIIANIIDPVYTPPLEGVPEAFHPIIQGCLQKQAEDRFADVAEMLEVLPSPQVFDTLDTSGEEVTEQSVAADEEEPGFFTEVAEGESSWRTRTSVPESTPEELTQFSEGPKSGESKIPVPQEKKPKAQIQGKKRRKRSPAWALIPLILLLFLASWIAYVGDWWNLFERSQPREITRSSSSPDLPMPEGDSLTREQPMNLQEEYPMENTNQEINQVSETLEENYSYPDDTSFRVPRVEVNYEAPKPVSRRNTQPKPNKNPQSPQVNTPQTPPQPTSNPNQPRNRRTVSTLSNSGGSQEIKYEYLEEYSTGKIVGLNGKFGIVDPKGNEIIPIIYDKISFFNDGLAAARKGSKWGYLDRRNMVKIPFKYDIPGNFVSGKARVYRGGTEYVIDKNGKEKRVATN